METSTTVIPKTTVGRIIGRYGNKINKIQLQNNVEITTSLTVSDYQDVKITGNANNINNALKEISEIVLCKNFSSNCHTYGPDCKFKLRNNIEIKNNQQPNRNTPFNITHGISNADIQNKKNHLQSKQTIGQQIHAAKVIEDQIIQMLNQKALTEIIKVSLKDYLNPSLVAVKQ